MALPILRVCLANISVGLLLVACAPLSLPQDNLTGGNGGIKPATDAGITTPLCWRSQELATDVRATVFTLDAQGIGHFAYIRSGTNELKVGTAKSGVSLKDESIGGANYIANIAVDARGATHLAFTDEWGSVIYATNATGGWEHTKVSQGQGLDMALDSDGFAHILFLDNHSSRQLFYANNRSGTWRITDFDVVLSSSSSAVLALDAADHTHVAYGANKGLFYANNISGTWQHELVGYTSYGFNDPALSLSPNGQPRIALGTAAGWVDLATRHDSNWVFSSIATSFGIALDVVVDERDVAHLAMSRAADHRLDYATNAIGSWQLTTAAFEQLPNSMINLWSATIQLERGNGPHIAYLMAVREGEQTAPISRFRYLYPCP